METENHSENSGSQTAAQHATERRLRQQKWYLLNKYYISSILLILLVCFASYFFYQNKMIENKTGRLTDVVKKDSTANAATAIIITKVLAEERALKSQADSSQKLMLKTVRSTVRGFIKTAVKSETYRSDKAISNINKRILFLEEQQANINKRVKAAEDSLSAKAEDKKNALFLLEQANRKIAADASRPGNRLIDQSMGGNQKVKSQYDGDNSGYSSNTGDVANYQPIADTISADTIKKAKACRHRWWRRKQN